MFLNMNKSKKLAAVASALVVSAALFAGCGGSDTKQSSAPADTELTGKIAASGSTALLPLLKPALATVALFTFVGVYRDYLGPLIYLTNQEQWTISLGLKMFQNMYGAQWQLMMAASALTMIPTVVLFFLTQRTFIEGIALTGIKG